ncbi:MAG: exonuclease domain-containing protein [Flavobacteriaceae bacterium]
MYCIVDIETTGNGIIGNKITEISIFKFNGEEIVDEYTTLVNPECEIPYFITGLTGIDNHTVRNAPTFGEVAHHVAEITKDMIFVAHSVNFDYNVIKHEFKALGQSFVRKKLCTVRLSRRLYPGLQSYSLGKLCSSLEIPLKDRHRARGDAHATVLLFHKIIKTGKAEPVISNFLNARSQEATLPPALDREVYDRLPPKTGVYYFKNSKGSVIYVGKAKNIKKRILGHFYDKSTREIELCKETTMIDFELAGSELVALLMESAAIKHYYPKYNRAQKRRLPAYGIFSYADRNGILHLGYNKVSSIPSHFLAFYSTTDCRMYLEELCTLFELCPKYCHLQENVDECNHFRIPQCGGICRGNESTKDYNNKVEAAIAHMKSGRSNFLIKEKGRNISEEAIVLIRDGKYAGYGFISKDEEIRTLNDAIAYLVPQKDSLETQRLILSYTVKNPEKVLGLDGLDL